MAKKRKIKIRRARKRGGLKLDFISAGALRGLTLDQKIASILKKVRENHIVILDEALDFIEEAKLVTSTMEEIDTNFKGIEFCTLPKKGNVLVDYATKTFERLTGKQLPRHGLTLVGPSSIIKEIKRDPQAFHVSAEL